MEEKRMRYQKRMQYFAEHPGLCRAVHILNSILTYTVFVLYPVLLVILWRSRPEFLASAIIVPMNSFLILTVFRVMVNRKRPYEQYGISPAIKKNTRGKSFPSRHVFSVFIIAMSYLCISPFPQIGAGLLIVGGVLAFLRVLVGVHYLSDVLCGAFVGILAGWVGYLVF